MANERIDEMRELVNLETEGPVLSVFCRTDPRDPANRAKTPGWLIRLRNGLREAGETFEGDHDVSEQVSKLIAAAESRMTSRSTTEHGRSAALFMSVDGRIDSFQTFQIPVRDDNVSLDSGAVVWPMVDVFDRGQRTGLVLVSRDHIRLLEWVDGHAIDLEQSTYNLELGDWHDYRGAARPARERPGRAVNNVDAYEDRVTEWIARFVKDASAAIAESAGDLKMDRLLVAAEADLRTRFVEALPAPTRELLIGSVSANLIDLTAAEVAEHLDPHLRESWLSEVNRIADLALERVEAGGPAATGPDETLLALAEGRVEHLLVDPFLEAGDVNLSEGAQLAITDAGESSLQEASVELALRTDAKVSSASVDEVPALEKAGGALALLRY